jgi:N-acetylneuraminic acid mutarotase
MSAAKGRGESPAETAVEAGAAKAGEAEHQCGGFRCFRDMSRIGITGRADRILRIPTPSATSTLNRCFALNLAAIDPAWREIPWPIGQSGRILAVAAAHDGWFYLFSGADLSPNAQGQPERHYFADAWRYRPDASWQRLTDLPHAVAAAPSPAMSDGGTRLVIAGGVSPEFLASLPKNAPHPGFTRELLAYDTATNTWTAVTPLPDGPPSRVTAPLAPWQDRWVIPSGEVAPGIRTPTVLSFRFTP